MYERYEDDQYFNVIKNHVTGEILDDAGEIADLLQDYLVKNTKLEALEIRGYYGCRI